VRTCVRASYPVTEQELREAILASRSFSDALRRLGLRPAGGNHATIKKYTARWGIDVSHFDHDAIRAAALIKPATPLRELLVEYSTYHRGHLKRRLLAEGLKQPVCELCAQGELWQGRRMALILDHVNGVPDDNRLENLRIVCPNCAATLETHCGRKNRVPPRYYKCRRCGVSFVPKAIDQRYCSRACGQRWDRAGHPRPGGRRVERPPYGQLIAEVEATSYAAVGRKYGVSDNAIRKWLRQYERERAASSGSPDHGSERSRLMSGTASRASVAASTSAAASQREASIPASAATGPQIARPSGWNAREPNQS
jgi:transposase-like protein